MCQRTAGYHLQSRNWVRTPAESRTGTKKFSVCENDSRNICFRLGRPTLRRAKNKASVGWTSHFRGLFEQWLTAPRARGYPVVCCVTVVVLFVFAIRTATKVYIFKRDTAPLTREGPSQTVEMGASPLYPVALIQAAHEIFRRMLRKTAGNSKPLHQRRPGKSRETVRQYSGAGPLSKVKNRDTGPG